MIIIILHNFEANNVENLSLRVNCFFRDLPSSRLNRTPEVTDLAILSESPTQDTFSCIPFIVYNSHVYVYHLNFVSICIDVNVNKPNFLN
jgi:hypothetical protein